MISLSRTLAYLIDSLISLKPLIYVDTMNTGAIKVPILVSTYIFWEKGLKKNRPNSHALNVQTIC